MYVIGPHPTIRQGVVEIACAERQLFAGSAEFLTDPTHRAEIGRYLSDMVRPHGLTLHPDLFDGVQVSPDLGQSYGEMAEALIGAVVAPDDPVDVLILAFAVHDVRPGRATSTYLSHVCPGNPLAFAVCDQGSAAAFTGLRLAREYLVSGGCRRALLLVVEQDRLPYAVVAPARSRRESDSESSAAPMLAEIPSRNAGVALVCTAGAGGTTATAGRLHCVRQHCDVAPTRVNDLVAAEITELSEGRADVTVVLGGPLTQHLSTPWPGQRVRAAPDGQPSTGVWWELVGSLAEHDGTGLVVLVDYDPGLGYVSVAAVDRA